MEAKDTVMKPKEISKTVGLFYSGGSSGLERVAIKQAEISFPLGEKEGIRKVVDWLSDTRLCEHKIARKKCPVCWEKQLQEWGIKEGQSGFTEEELADLRHNASDDTIG